MKYIYPLIIVVVLAAGWYLYRFYFGKSDSDETANRDRMTQEQREQKELAEAEWNRYYQLLDRAWHNPDDRDILPALIRLSRELDDPEVQQYAAIAAALASRLQNDRGRYREVTSFLASRYPHGPARQILSLDDITEPCRDCYGSGVTPVNCRNCHGSGDCSNRMCNEGEISYTDARGRELTRDCPVCEATGQCPDCHGEGMIDQRCRRCRGSGQGEPGLSAIKTVYRDIVERTINLAAGHYNAFNGQYRYESGTLVSN